LSAAKPSTHALTFVLVTVFIDMAGAGLVFPVMPRLIEEVGSTGLAGASVTGGWLFVAYGLTQFIFGPASGNLSDAFGRRPLLLLSVFGLAVDYLLTAFAPNLVWLFAGRLFAGLCGASYTIANAYIADITLAEERAKAFGLVGAAFGLGFILGPAIGGLLGEYGARVPFFAAAGLSAVNLVYGYFVLPETLPKERRRPFSLGRSNPVGAFKVFATYRDVLPLSLVMFMYFFATASYPAIWAFWGIGKFGWTESIIGLTLAAFGLITAVTQGALTGPVVRWLGERGAVILGLCLAAIAATGFGLAPSLAAVLVLLLIHAPEGFVNPALTAIMSRQAPDDAQGELQGGIASLGNIGMVLGTLFFTQVFGYFMRAGALVTSPNIPFYMTSALVALTLILFLSVTRRG
jgi:MFS transporter, DHA1 family, tetracycline resistance protein